MHPLALFKGVGLTASDRTFGKDISFNMNGVPQGTCYHHSSYPFYPPINSPSPSQISLFHPFLNGQFSQDIASHW